MKILSILFFFLSFSFVAHCQMPKKSPEKAVRFLADKILSNTSHQIMDFSTGEVFNESDNLPVSPSVRVKSKLTDWHYENGLMNIAMFRTGQYLSDKKYSNFVVKNYEFVNSHYDYFKKQFNDTSIKKSSFRQLYDFHSLDNCGTMGAALLELSEEYEIEHPLWKEIIERTEHYIMHEEFRLPDGTLCRDYPRPGAVWADDLYMSVAFLARMGYYTGEEKYFEFAAKQVHNFTKYLRDDYLNVYNHAYFDNEKIVNGAFWGRANGWVMMAQVELLTCLPDDHSLKPQLLETFRDFVNGIVRLQSSDGLWHQLLNKNDSFLESSCSAMFTYSIARAVNQGWIDSSFSQVAWRGWEGLYQNITEDAQVKDICVGTHVEMNLPFYYNRPVSVNDTHGLAATLMAGVEIVKMSEKYSQKVYPRSF